MQIQWGEIKADSGIYPKINLSRIDWQISWDEGVCGPVYGSREQVGVKKCPLRGSPVKGMQSANLSERPLGLV